MADYAHITSPAFYGHWKALNGPDYDIENPCSINEIVNIQNDSALTLQTIFTSDLVDVRPKHAFYMHCLDLGDGGSMGWNGRMRTCIAVMPFNVGFGLLLTYFGSGTPTIIPCRPFAR